MEKEEKQLNEKRVMKTNLVISSLMFFILTLGMYLYYVKNIRLHGYGYKYDESVSITSSKNFYNLARAYFAETGATSVPSDGPPGFHPFDGVTINGGPMNWDGTKVTFTTPLIFRYKDSSVSIILKADGGYEILRDSRKAKKD